MGIKGIYKEIGPGKRISATKLAVDKLEQTGRPFRLAIDISIWQFQVQAARGGSNPAIRTLFYRLLRLLGLSIQPIFVFDGPNKPVFKRNKRSGRGDGVATSMAKRMIRLFGFQIHDAPGEAEAECALLEQQGIVDAVLSEDVDTIMFGCRRTLRNWSSEGTKAKTPTHMSMYDIEELQKGGSGLDREGMVLVALMSGGDYIPEGIPGAGVKLACEAARAGFGKRLCQLKRADTSELNSWREWLVYELRHNESGFFRTRHKALHVPDDFPNLDVLRYYTHPVVSPAATLERLRNQTWEKPIDVEGLREFVRETFDWNYRIGAIKFIRVLAPCLLVRKLMDRNARGDQGSEDISSIQKEESELVNSISSRRAHFSTDATSELRISFIPTNIVGYDFQEEPDKVISYGRDGLALNSDDEFEALGEEEAEALAARTPKKPFSPTDPDLYWIPETIAKFGIPLMVEDWEAAQRNKAKGRQKAKAPKPKQKAKVGRASAGALDNFVKVTKNIPKSTGMGKPKSFISCTVHSNPRKDKAIHKIHGDTSRKAIVPIAVGLTTIIAAVAKRETQAQQVSKDGIPAPVVGTKTRRGFARAQTIAVDVTVLSDSDPEVEGEDEEDEEAGEDSDPDLPPLSSLVNKLPPPSTAGKSIAKSTAKNNTNGRTSTVSLLSSPPPPPPPATASRKKSEQLRTTKLYVPRKSQPGYFKEIDVTVEEAEVLKAHVAAGGPGGGRGRAWRRSDIECIDLTGHD
ncbi:putative flap structure-specific endonuclease protein [Eutypa lata UCREL1]|uniref:Putative flap structure-specific endonuclease protein n=1 Tax=Eutypa lata (strain UCR-EL1) TaxID=1287681 RepID=M7TC17_EUTLA|nr:putative flap structure-specific endonuclease protein [Eutypa lata UCREL1]